MESHGNYRHIFYKEKLREILGVFHISCKSFQNAAKRQAEIRKIHVRR
nr:MAG TPA: hypothetical protein [Caudoviricetes sp.]